MKNNSIRESLNFFNLRESYTINELKRVYYGMIKDNRLGNRSDITYEARVKIINQHYKNLLQAYQKKNTLYMEIVNENSQMEKERLLREKEKFELKKENFRQILEKHKKIYNSEKEIILICDKYLTLVDLACDLEEVNDYQNIYLNEIDKKINDMRQNNDFNFKARKNAFANAYSYYLYKSINKNQVDNSVRATKIYLDILNLINKCNNEEELDELLNKIQEIKIQDLDHDEKILTDLKTNYPIFINKYNGVKVFLINKNQDTVTYSRELKEEALISTAKFDYTFISLEDFIKNSCYVGNKKVEIHDKNGYIRGNLLNQRYLYYDENSGLMLLYSDDNDYDKFSFLNISFSDFNNFRKNFVNQRFFKIYSSSIKEDVEKGIYKDREFLYQSIVDYFKDKTEVTTNPLQLSENTSNIKKKN